MALKVYADRISQPSRAVVIFCKINGIDFEEIRVDISKNQQLSHEYKAINPMCQVPAIVDGRFKLFESHAILIYICSAFPQVASHWYPGDLSKRAKIHSVLDWHHTNLRRGSAGLVFNTVLAHHDGQHSYPQVVNQAEEILIKSLHKLQNFWLKDGRFLVGSSQPSIADISLVCEIMQLELLSEKEHDRILSPYKKVIQWIEDTKKATSPYFDEVHEVLFKFQKRIRERMTNEYGKNEIKSKLIIGIDLEEIQVNVLKGQHFSPEYKAINPMHQVPAMVDGQLKLFESHAILIYLSCAIPGVASHWYPSDPSKRAKINSVLDWHHSYLRRGAAGRIFNTILAPLSALRSYPQIIIQAEEILLRSLSKLENVWLKDERFLCGSSQPSIADISLACQIMQLELLSEKDYHRILSPYKKVKKWIEDTRSATAPYFDEVHEYLLESQKGIREQMVTKSGKIKARSKI